MQTWRYAKALAITAVAVIAALFSFLSENLNARPRDSLGSPAHGLIRAHQPTPPGHLHDAPGRPGSIQVIRRAAQNTAAAAETPASSGAPSKNVVIAGMRFMPATIQIKIGEKVTWINHEPLAHTLTSQNNGLLASEPLSRGAMFSHTFRQPGIYHYYCLLHPSKNGLVIVNQ